MKGRKKKKWVGSIGKNVEKLESLFAVGRNIRYCNHCGKEVGHFLKKLKIELLYDLAVPCLAIYPEKKKKKTNSKRYIIPIFTAALFTLVQDVEEN